jgi:hypothetical protein
MRRQYQPLLSVGNKKATSLPHTHFRLTPGGENSHRAVRYERRSGKKNRTRMSETTADIKPAEDGKNDSFAPITSQAELNRIIQDRVKRYSDYSDLKKKAAQFDQLQSEQMSELDKANQRAQAAEARMAELELSSARAQVAAGKGVPAELLTGRTVEDFESAADAILAFRDEGRAPRAPMPDPMQGAGTEDAGAVGDWLSTMIRG